MEQLSDVECTKILHFVVESCQQEVSGRKQKEPRLDNLSCILHLNATTRASCNSEAHLSFYGLSSPLFLSKTEALLYDNSSTGIIKYCWAPAPFLRAGLTATTERNDLSTQHHSHHGGKMG